MGSSVMRASLLRHTTAVFSLVVTATVSEAWWWEKINATCPRLDHCVCENGTYAVFIQCRHIADAHQLDGDMAKLLGIPHKKLTFESVNITDLPLEWFLNKKVNILYIFQCPLRNMSASVIESIQGLRKLRMKKGKLESVPPGLAAARHLSILRVSENPIKVLRGALSMPNLIELDLSHNAIENVDEEYLSAFPNLIRLNLSRNNISHLAPNILDKIKKVKYIQLRNNSLDTIEDQFHELLFLEHLDLSANHITSVNTLLKSKMTSVEKLWLEDNKIRTINRFSHYNTKIKELRLKNNVITEVELEAFVSLKNLLRLDLRQNKISALNEAVFGVDSKLDHLDISNNALISISGTFNRTRRITHLKLSFNLIRNITGAFTGLRDLKILSLTGNFLKYIEDSAFSDNLGLAHISVTENKIQWIGRNAFKGLVSLRSLRLERNQLHSLNGSIKNLPKLKYVEASGNSIRFLQTDEFENDSGLKYVYLSRNNISSTQGAFTAVAALMTLDVGHNRLETMRRSDFPRRMKQKLILIIRGTFCCDTNDFVVRSIHRAHKHLAFLLKTSFLKVTSKSS
uniref:Putative membrane glycoprotein lig-1 n=1 Tax=Rhipicephalus microplus TaxID=6941 RepID=A0A6M2CPA5_RHIMP